MILSFQNTLLQLETALKGIEEINYIKKSDYLDGATIGQHTRHILELAICLCHGYDGGIINYDKRNRDLQMETEILFALATLKNINQNIDRHDKDLVVVTFLADNEIRIKTTYLREVLYNMEHCIHHLALIKVALIELAIPVEKNFGVAPSTIKYREQCVQ